jgi:hypothetical protein
MPPTTYDVCSDVPTIQGGQFIWNNPHSKAVKIAPYPPGAAWPLIQPYPLVVTSGTTPATVNPNAALGPYPISVTYDTTAGGSPCSGPAVVNPKIIVGTSKR